MTRETGMRLSAMVMLGLLCLEFLLGMAVNLYTVIPETHPGAQLSDYFLGVVRGVGWAILGSGSGLLIVHAALGLLLALGTIWTVVAAIRTQRRSWVVTSLVGWFGVFAAGFNGASFLNYGHAFSSLIMSAGLLAALVSYAVGAYRAR